MCDRNENGKNPSCISALLDGPGAEDHGFCKPCADQIRQRWKELEASSATLHGNLDAIDLQKKRALDAEALIKEREEDLRVALEDHNKCVAGLEAKISELTKQGDERLLELSRANAEVCELKTEVIRKDQLTSELFKIADEKQRFSTMPNPSDLDRGWKRCAKTILDDMHEAMKVTQAERPKCQTKICSIHWGREICGHTLPCPISHGACGKCAEKRSCEAKYGTTQIPCRLPAGHTADHQADGTNDRAKYYWR